MLREIKIRFEKLNRTQSKTPAIVAICPDSGIVPCVLHRNSPSISNRCFVKISDESTSTVFVPSQVS
jgi:hypothetical protein